MIARPLRMAAAAFGLALLWQSASQAASLQPETLASWHAYVCRVKADVEAHSKNPDGFLWVTSEQKREQKVHGGDVAIAPLEHKGYMPVKSGLIHHWVGAMFIPGVSGRDLIATLQDYDAYSQLYGPSITQSKLMQDTDDRVFTYKLKMISKTFSVKAGLAGTFRSTYSLGSNGTGYSVTEDLELHELQNPGDGDERALPLDEARGFVLKTLNIMRYQEQPDGIFVELETLSLSRDIPATLRWFVTPLVQQASRTFMNTTLVELREGMVPALAASSHKAEQGTSLRRSFR